MRFRLEFISLELVKADAVVARVLCLSLSQVSDEHKFFLLGDVQRPCSKCFWQVGQAGALSERAVTGEAGSALPTWGCAAGKDFPAEVGVSLARGCLSRQSHQHFPAFAFSPGFLPLERIVHVTPAVVRLNTCHCVTVRVFSLCTGLGILQSQLRVSLTWRIKSSKKIF